MAPAVPAAKAVFMKSRRLMPGMLLQPHLAGNLARQPLRWYAGITTDPGEHLTAADNSTQPSRGRALSAWQKFTYSLGNFGVGYAPATFAFLAYYYYGRETAAGEKLVLVPVTAYSIIWFLCNALNGITDPVVGYLSDRTRSRLGRRKPWVLLGAPLLALSFYFVWAPPDTTPTLANQVVLFAALFGFWFFFTVVVGPYLALLPEITPYDNERVKLSALMSVFGDVLGTLGGNLLPVFVALLAGGLLIFTNGYQALAFLGALAVLAFSVLAVSFVKERYQPPESDSGDSRGWLRRALGEFRSTFHNPAFPPYLVGVFFYRTAIMITLTLTPFVATKIIGAVEPSAGDLDILALLPGVVNDRGLPDFEQAAGYLMMVVLVGAMLLFVPVSALAARLGKKKLFVVALFLLGGVLGGMSLIGLVPVLTPLGQALLLFALAAVPVAIALVVTRPLLADVIDADEEITGLRREGVYNGMEGLIMKVAAGLGPLLAGIIFEIFGASRAHSLGIRICGPVAGACLVLAAFAFRRYPIEK